MQAETNRAHLEALPPSEWSRLVRLCAYLSGSADVAEDLAQESLIEAWRHAGRLRDPSAHRAWLAGIARNVSLRWRRQRARETARQEMLESHERTTHSTALSGDADFDVERGEMETLLDRALSTLPTTTRDVLVLRFIDDLGNREIARRLDLSDGAVAVRLHRGKAALRKALAEPHLRDDAAAFGLVDPEDAGWRQARIWCPFCGRHRLKTRIEPGDRILFAVCEGPCLDAGAIVGGSGMHPDTARLTSIKSIVARELVHLNDAYRSALADGGSHCVSCGRYIAIASWHPDRPSPTPTAHLHGIQLRCGHCGSESTASLWHLLIDTPEAQRFWRRHPRMAALPAREIQVEGRPALLSGFASNDGARIEFVSARDSFDILHIGGPDGE